MVPVTIFENDREDDRRMLVMQANMSNFQSIPKCVVLGMLGKYGKEEGIRILKEFLECEGFNLKEEDLVKAIEEYCIVDEDITFTEEELEEMSKMYQ